MWLTTLIKVEWVIKEAFYFYLVPKEELSFKSQAVEKKFTVNINGCHVNITNKMNDFNYKLPPSIV